MQQQQLDSHRLPDDIGNGPSHAGSTAAEPLAADAGNTPGWLRGVHARVLVAGMAALGILALVYPDARRREISSAMEAIHQCDLGAASNALDADARAQARAHCHALRVQYTQRYGQEP